MLNTVLAILLQALGAVLFFNRFIAGVALRFLKKQAFDEADYEYRPTVTVVVPMYNEGVEIRRTLTSLLALDYPTAKLDVVVIDDCSTDDSFAHATAVAATSGGRLTVLRNKHNLGKRRSINRAVLASTSEIIVSVDSDVVVAGDAVRELALAAAALVPRGSDADRALRCWADGYGSWAFQDCPAPDFEAARHHRSTIGGHVPPRRHPRWLRRIAAWVRQARRDVPWSALAGLAAAAAVIALARRGLRRPAMRP